MNQVKDLDSKIEKRRDVERELWAMATSVTQNYSGMPHGSGDNDQMTDIVKKLLDARKQTLRKIAEYAEVKQNVIDHLERLSRKQRDVLYWLYVKKKETRGKGQKWYYTWSEVAENLGCTEQNIGNVRRKAIKNLQKILDSEEKSTKVD